MIKPENISQAAELHRELNKLAMQFLDLKVDRIDVFIGGKNITRELQDDDTLDRIRDMALDRVAGLYRSTLVALREIGVDVSGIAPLDPEPTEVIALPAMMAV